MGYITENEILLYKELREIETERDEVIFKKLILFKENIRLANSIISKISTPYDAALDRDDVAQEGYLGLWKACLGYDESYGTAFSTYAVPVIRGQIYRLLRDSGALKIPRWFKDIRSALMEHGFTIPLNDAEIDILVSEGKFSRYQIMQYAEPDIASLDFLLSDDSDSTLGDLIPDESADIEKNLSDSYLDDIVSGLLEYVKPQYRDMIEEWMYSVLVGDKPVSQLELGEKYNLSQCHVSRVLKSTIELLRNSHEDEVKSLFGI